MLSANQIAGFLDQVFLQKNSMKTVSFLACWYKFTKIKGWLKTFCLDMVKNWYGQSGPWTLKLTVSQEWIDGMNWVFAWWCKFMKAKSYFTDYWVTMVKNGHGHLVHETLNSAECLYEMGWFFACWLWFNNFWLDTLYSIF